MVLALLSGIIPKLPSALRLPLQFIGIEAYLQKSASRVGNFEAEQEERKRKESARKIERERPTSPSKTTKIGFPSDEKVVKKAVVKDLTSTGKDLAKAQDTKPARPSASKDFKLTP